MGDIEKISTKTKGGARPGSGRKKGSPNKVTAEVRTIAQQHGEEAINILAEMMTNGQSEASRIAAAKEILDRAYGKSTQYEEVNHSGTITQEVREAPKLTKEEWLKAHGLKP